jgi:hypothetical protein
MNHWKDLLDLRDDELRAIDPLVLNLLVAKGIPLLAAIDIDGYRRMAAAARGELLYFLDGDDLYLPEHLVVCYWALQFTPQAGFAKTGVVLADPVHPDWRPRIEGSVVLNLCVRRQCHEAVGGFPDYHLFVRHGDGFKHLSDIFYKFEDQFYNQLLAKRFTGVAVRRETVQYLRYPGNSYDRQYEKFRRPFGTYQADVEPEDRLRLRLGEAIIQECLHQPGSSAP